MGAAEDGNDPDCRPQAAVASQHDVMANASDVCLPHFIISQWAGYLLGGIKCYQDWYPIFCYRVGGVGWITAEEVNCHR